MRGSLLAAAALVALLGLAPALAGCSSAAAPDPFVTADGRGFVAGGEPLTVVGYNVYDAAATDSFSCRPASRLDDAGVEATFAELADQGVTAVRFWAYQTYTVAGRDWSGVDRVVAAAEAHGMHVLPVLEDGPGDCSTGQAGVSLDRVDGDTWYTKGYRRPLGSATMSFRDYAPMVAAHYRDEPTILGWTLVNEAETSQRDAAGRSVLVGFAQDMAARVRAADPNHLVTLGTQANGAPGTSGPDFRDVYSLPDLGFAEVHDWPREGRDPTQAMPGAVPDGTRAGALPEPGSPQCRSLAAPVACSFALARRLGKPLVVGEVGITATDAEQRRQRAEVLAGKMRAAFADGAAGYLLWHWSSAQTDGYDVVPGTDDPVVAVVERVAREQAARAGRSDDG